MLDKTDQISELRQDFGVLAHSVDKLTDVLTSFQTSVTEHMDKVDKALRGTVGGELGLLTRLDRAERTIAILWRVCAGLGTGLAGAAIDIAIRHLSK
tara:strand:+ start:992 stop:1282 length:291 start_codon:yes stop_codon:yes gene_type:complete